MATKTFEQGGVVIIPVTFTDPASVASPIDPVSGNTLVDPTTVHFTLRNPDKTVTGPLTYGIDPAVVKTGVGAYQYILPLSQTGAYYWRWEGLSTNKGVDITGALNCKREPTF